MKNRETVLLPSNIAFHVIRHGGFLSRVQLALVENMTSTEGKKVIPADIELGGHLLNIISRPARPQRGIA